MPTSAPRAPRLFSLTMVAVCALGACSSDDAALVASGTGGQGGTGGAGGVARGGAAGTGGQAQGGQTPAAGGFAGGLPSGGQGGSAGNAGGEGGQAGGDGGQAGDKNGTGEAGGPPAGGASGGEGGANAGAGAGGAAGKAGPGGKGGVGGKGGAAGAPPAPVDVVDIEAKHLIRNGKPFRVHGVQIDAFVAPRSYLVNGNTKKANPNNLNDHEFTVYLTAHDHWVQHTDDVLAAAKTFGANTIEFKVSQPGSDIEDPAFGQGGIVAGYRAQVVKAVTDARAAGFIVILSLQNTYVSGNNPAYPNGCPPKGCVDINADGQMHTVASRRVLKWLSNQFGDDRGVLLEMLVEPFGPPSLGGQLNPQWRAYLEGDTKLAVVGVNDLLADMRTAGAKNVIIVEALDQNFSKYAAYQNSTPKPPPFHDPLGRLALGSHPYFAFTGVTPAEWNQHFGNIADQYALIVTEWHETTGPASSAPYGWCEKAPLSTPLECLKYMNTQGIDGIVGWAFDNPATFVSDLNGTPTSLAGAKCGENGFGMGVLFQKYFSGDPL